MAEKITRIAATADSLETCIRTDAWTDAWTSGIRADKVSVSAWQPVSAREKKLERELSEIRSVVKKIGADPINENSELGPLIKKIYQQAVKETVLGICEMLNAKNKTRAFKIWVGQDDIKNSDPNMMEKLVSVPRFTNDLLKTFKICNEDLERINEPYKSKLKEIIAESKKMDDRDPAKEDKEILSRKIQKIIQTSCLNKIKKK